MAINLREIQFHSVGNKSLNLHANEYCLWSLNIDEKLITHFCRHRRNQSHISHNGDICLRFCVSFIFGFSVSRIMTIDLFIDPFIGIHMQTFDLNGLIFGRYSAFGGV